MLCRDLLLGYSVFLLAVLVLQMRNANAKSLVAIQGSPHSGTSLATTVTTTTVTRTTIRDQPSEPTSPKQVSTTKGEETQASEMSPPAGSEEVLSPTTVVIQPTTEEPPCWKENKKITVFLEQFSMFGMSQLQDFTRPECDSSGYYKPLQCHYGGCQCVDGDGTPTSKFSSEFGLVCPETKTVSADFSLP